ncbi:MAG: UbiA prenyltransferase family protein [Methanogenium sp.]|nr:UbiA prenyltransferase family protein [Methanogenium sp.]
MDQIPSYIKMLRIRDWIKFYPVFPLIGAYLACGISLNLIPVCIIFICVIGYGFVINNYFDVEIDKKHQEKVELDKNPLAGGHVTKRGTLLLSAGLVAVATMLSAMMSVYGFLFTVLSILALTLYSAEPLRLKDRFLVDILTHGLMFGGFPFLAGFTLVAGTDLFLSPQLPIAVASLCTIICCEALIAHEINDYREDLGNTYTTVVKIGQRNGGILMGLLLVLSLINLELIVYYFGIGTYLHLGIFALLVTYPVYSCRGEVVVQMKRVYEKVQVSGYL